jgi:hypothetical protein
MRRNNRSVAPSICVTIDYELFGNGAGDIQTHIIRPTEELLTFFATKDIRATFFVEVAELLAFAEATRERGSNPLLVRNYDAIRGQLERVVAQGHDIQLHIHPQWLGAYRRNGLWFLSSEHCSLLQWGEEPLKELVQWGRTLLETLGHESQANYACRIFRAGGLHFDRTPTLGELLLNSGLLMDSSICRGYHRRTLYADIDYRDLLAVRLPWWTTLDGSVAAETGSEVLREVPVWAMQRRQWSKLTPNRLANKFRRDVPGLQLQRSMTQAEISRNPLGVLSWLMQRRPLIWDFCLMTRSQLIEAYKAAQQFHQVDGFFPLVMLGHTKELRSLVPLSQLHAYLSNRETVNWITMSEALDRILAQNRRK